MYQYDVPVSYQCLDETLVLPRLMRTFMRLPRCIQKFIVNRHLWVYRDITALITQDRARVEELLLSEKTPILYDKQPEEANHLFLHVFLQYHWGACKMPSNYARSFDVINAEIDRQCRLKENISNLTKQRSLIEQQRSLAHLQFIIEKLHLLQPVCSNYALQRAYLSKLSHHLKNKYKSDAELAVEVERVIYNLNRSVYMTYYSTIESTLGGVEFSCAQDLLFETSYWLSLGRKLDDYSINTVADDIDKLEMNLDHLNQHRHSLQYRHAVKVVFCVLIVLTAGIILLPKLCYNYNAYGRCCLFPTETISYAKMQKFINSSNVNNTFGR